MKVPLSMSQTTYGRLLPPTRRVQTSRDAQGLGSLDRRPSAARKPLGRLPAVMAARLPEILGRVTVHRAGREPAWSWGK